MICKESSDGIGYCLVELNDTRHIFAAAAPRNGGSLAEQARDALRTITQVTDREGRRGSIVHQAVFLRDPSQTEECRRLIQEFYGDELPATTYIAQPPCDGKLVAIEALGVGRDGEGVEIERRGEQVVIARHNGVTWIHCSQIVPQIAGGSVYDRSSSALESMRELVTSAGARYEDVLRTWLYLGDIVGPEGPVQRYQELNRARSDFFRDIDFSRGRAGAAKGQVYPASTGIGTSNGDVVMSAVAMLSERDDVVLMPLENPHQVSAFDYAEHYSPKSPKFARAMAVVSGNVATIFVSGTASITDSESQHLEDVEKQTHQTLDNIAALVSESNFQRHGLPGLGAGLEDMALMRVYIKRAADYLKVRAACQARLGDLPTIYAVADVCRPELLVEIEGVAFSHRCAG